MSSFAKRQLQVDMKSKAKRHDVRIMASKFERRDIFRQRFQIHLEKVQRESPIDVMKFVAILFVSMFLIDFLQIALVIRTFWVDAFVDFEA